MGLPSFFDFADVKDSWIYVLLHETRSAVLEICFAKPNSLCGCAFTRRNYNLGENRFRSEGLIAFAFCACVPSVYRRKIKFPTRESHLLPFGFIEVVVGSFYQSRGWKFSVAI